MLNRGARPVKLLKNCISVWSPRYTTFNVFSLPSSHLPVKTIFPRISQFQYATFYRHSDEYTWCTWSASRKGVEIPLVSQGYWSWRSRCPNVCWSRASSHPWTRNLPSMAIWKRSFALIRILPRSIRCSIMKISDCQFVSSTNVTLYSSYTAIISLNYKPEASLNCSCACHCVCARWQSTAYYGRHNLTPMSAVFELRGLRLNPPS